MGKLPKTLVDYNENDKSWTQVKHVFHSHTQLTAVQKAYKWEDGLPGPIYEIIFSYLGYHDLKACRNVCRDWSLHSTPFFNEKSTIAFNGSGALPQWRKTLAKVFSTISTPDKRFVNIIRNNPTWTKTWPNLGLHNANYTDIRTLTTVLTPEIKQLAFNHISTLELKRCTLSWSQYSSLLKEFPSLTSFTDTNTDFYFDESWSFFCKSPSEVEDYIVDKYGKGPLNIKTLKIQRPCVKFKTLLYIKLLNSLMIEGIESFEFKVQNIQNSGPIGHSIDYASMLGLFLLKHLPTLQELSFEWGGERCFFYLDDLYKIVRIMTFFATPLLITKLNLHFDYLFLGNNTFQEVLVPFVQSLKHLKFFSLKKIILQPEWIGLLLLARPNNYEMLQTEINLGILLSDHPTREFATENINNIQGSDSIQDRIVSFRVAVSSPETQELKDILPLNGVGSYSRVTELLVNRMDLKKNETLVDNRRVRGLKTFNIDLICCTFENLTILGITDGSVFPYYSKFRVSRQYDKMSMSTLGDREMQLIIRSLTKLQKLRLRLRMNNLSDFGLTGWAKETCNKMNQSKDYSLGSQGFNSTSNNNNNNDDKTGTGRRIGLPISNLRDLDEIILKGLGKKITNVTAFCSFERLEKLKILGIFGDHQITSLGKKHLQSLLPESRGCVLYVT